jgi:uncharacterized membrane protein YjgN (DUF898 family)
MDEAARSTQSIEFTGRGSEYFGIWIVNLVLTILTLGIFSPWAKVRRLRYFYGNTLLAGSPFEFHGSPMAILKGRLIAGALLLAYSQSEKVSITLWVAVVVAIAIAFPWMFWRSLKFRLGNSSYRGVRFHFAGSLRDAYLAFGPPIILYFLPFLPLYLIGANARPTQPPSPWLFAPLGIWFLVVLALGPWLYYRILRYQHANARLGTEPFAFTGTVGGIYGLSFAILGIAVVLGILGAIAGFVFGGVAGWISRLVDLGGPEAIDRYVGFGFGIIAGYFVFLGIYPISTAMRQNYLWRGTTLAGRPFASDVDEFALWRIDAANLFLLLVTFGLYWPFALVRHLRYRLSQLAWNGDPQQILADVEAAPVGATGEEAVEMFGFDLAL